MERFDKVYNEIAEIRLIFKNFFQQISKYMMETLPAKCPVFWLIKKIHMSWKEFRRLFSRTEGG